MIKISDVYWVAGLMEGEGWFGHRRNGDLVIQLTMTDRDVIDRLQTVLGFGCRKERNLPSGKVAYIWSLTNQCQAAGLMMTIVSAMGERRANRIKECIAEWKRKPLPRSMWTHCKNGHAFTPENTRMVMDGKYEKRCCRKCSNLRTIKYRQSRAAI